MSLPRISNYALAFFVEVCSEISHLFKATSPRPYKEGFLSEYRPMWATRN